MKLIRKRALIFLLALAFLRGSLYALSMPPWGLLDEQQHFDYVLKVLRFGKPPVVGKDFLEKEVVESTFSTQRHAKFHWPSPASADVKDMGLEGYSYEGHQGPLFYFLSAPFLALMPNNTLDQLFGMRLVMVGWSLLTVWFAVLAAKELDLENNSLPYVIGAVLVTIPERTITTSRFSNDVLLEIISALFLLIFIRIVMRGLTWKKSVWFGVLAGFGLITKISFAGLLILFPIAFVACMHERYVVYKIALAGLLTILISSPFFAYSYNLYGDPTGIAGFQSLYTAFAPVWAPPFQLSTAVKAAWDLFCSFWLIWWKGAEAGSRPYLDLFWASLMALTLVAIAGYGKEIRSWYTRDKRRFIVMLSLIIVVIVFIFITLVGFYRGVFPVMQGRFLSPVFVPAVLIGVIGLWKHRWSRALILPGCVLLLVFDAASLFGNLLPYHYYYAEPFLSGEAVPPMLNNLGNAVAILVKNFPTDKPTWSVALFVVFLFLYVGSLFWLVFQQVFAFLHNSKPEVQEAL